MPKSCPRCGLLNPPRSPWCDCGYSFVAGRTLTVNHGEEAARRHIGSLPAADARPPRWAAAACLAMGVVGCGLGVWAFSQSPPVLTRGALLVMLLSPVFVLLGLYSLLCGPTEGGTRRR